MLAPAKISLWYHHYYCALANSNAWTSHGDNKTMVIDCGCPISNQQWNVPPPLFQTCLLLSRTESWLVTSLQPEPVTKSANEHTNANLFVKQMASSDASLAARQTELACRCLSPAMLTSLGTLSVAVRLPAYTRSPGTRKGTTASLVDEY